MNNPLAVLLGEAILLEDEAQGTPFADSAARMRRAAESCSAILSAVATLITRPEPEREPLDLATLACDLHEGAALAPLPVRGDRRQLTQALARLLDNARATGAAVRLSGGRDGATAWIEVADDGPGIAPDLAPRIFDPFVTTKPRAAGLGLPFARAVAEAHGGTLDLLPSPRGARFRLTLPLTETAPSPAPAPRQGNRALVVDDEPDLAETLAEMLEDEGFAVDLAFSGSGAIERLGAERYDLVLSDLSMPGTDGPALRAWIAANRPALLPALAFLTGEASGAAARALAGDGHPFLLKPFTPQELRDLLRRLGPGTLP